ARRGSLARNNASLAARNSRYISQREQLMEISVETADLLDSSKELSDLRVLKLHSRFAKFYERWSSSSTSGFANQNLAFVVAMDKAGWRWGARFRSPDFHHFEYQAS